MTHTLARSQQITCIGIDLAWSPRNPTGAAVMRGDAHGGTLRHTGLLGDHRRDRRICRSARRCWPGDRGGGCAAVGAERDWAAGRRGRDRPGAFARYHAGAHPANRRRRPSRWRARRGVGRRRLSAIGFAHDRATVEAGVATRQVVEVYPHPAMVALFELDKTLKYKAKPAAAWRRASGLAIVPAAPGRPGLRRPAATWPGDLADRDVDQLSGRDSKTMKIRSTR